jgi:hypothetical protein
MIPDEVRAQIAARLASAASDGGVRVLYAPESGSRAWGFPSPDSDFDAWAVGELERLDPDRLPWTDAPGRDMRDEADRLYRRIVGVGA